MHESQCVTKYLKTVGRIGERCWCVTIPISLGYGTQDCMFIFQEEKSRYSYLVSVIVFKDSVRIGDGNLLTVTELPADRSRRTVVSLAVKT